VQSAESVSAVAARAGATVLAVRPLTDAGQDMLIAAPGVGAQVLRPPPGAQLTVPLRITLAAVAGAARAASAKARSVLVPITYHFPPAALEARIDGRGAALRVLFDADTDRGGARGKTAVAAVPCQDMLNLTSGAGALLGAAPRCAWASARELEVLFGPGALALPGDELLLAPRFGLRSANGLSLPLTGAALPVLPPEVRARVAMNVKAPVALGACDDAVLDVFYEHPRPLGLTWECVNCDAQPLLAPLRAHLARAETTRVVVPSSMLQLTDFTYKFRISGLSYLGGFAAPRVVEMHKAALPMPTLRVEVPERVRPALGTYLRARADFTQCNEEQERVVWTWAVLAAPPGISAAARAALEAEAGPTVVLPRGSLAAGEYAIRVRAALPGAVPPQTAETVISFDAAPGALAARVLGGGREAGAGQVLRLDASASLDPDAPQDGLSGMGFAWACVEVASGQRCRDPRSGLALTLPRVAALEVPAGALAPGGSYTLTVTVSKDGRASSAATTVALAAAYRVPLLLRTSAVLAGGRYYLPSDEATLDVTAELEDSAALHSSVDAFTLQWAVDGEPEPGARAATLRIPPGRFAEGVTATISVRATRPARSGDACAGAVCEGEAALQVTVNRKPFGGACALQAFEARLSPAPRRAPRPAPCGGPCRRAGLARAASALSGTGAHRWMR
jgi:hypothetical protein